VPEEIGDLLYALLDVEVAKVRPSQAVRFVDNRAVCIAIESASRNNHTHGFLLYFLKLDARHV
jgi:hypothetical protein